jgi:hypothetical protein
VYVESTYKKSPQLCLQSRHTRYHIYIKFLPYILYCVELICIDASYIINAINSGFQFGMILHPVAEFM